MSTFGRAGGNSGISKDLKIEVYFYEAGRAGAPAHKIQFQQEYGTVRYYAWSGDLKKNKHFFRATTAQQRVVFRLLFISRIHQFMKNNAQNFQSNRTNRTQNQSNH